MAEPAPHNLPEKPFWLPWFLDIPGWELEIQVQEYRTLPWHRSYRKLSVAFLLFLAAVPVLLVVLLPGAPNPFGRLLSSGIYVLLAIFVSRGSRFALGVTMVLFTFSRVTDIAANVVSPLTWAINLAWWMFFMERFWKAYRVEQARALVSGPGSQSGPDVATP